MLQGPIYWAKILGDPQPGYDKRSREWSFDLGVTKDGQKKLDDLRVSPDYIKTKEGHVAGGPFIKFKRGEFKVDGAPSQPFRVVDSAGNEWPRDKLIGNGSIVNVKFAVNETSQGKNKPSAIAIQVWDWVEVEGQDDFPNKPNEDW